MSQVCYTTTVQELVPGTGVWSLRDNASWEGRAVSVEGRNSSDNFRYSFDPIHGNAYFSGIFDYQANPVPLPEQYIAAFEVQDRSYRVWVRGEPQSESFVSWSTNDRFHIQYENGRVRFYVNEELVWG